MSKKKLQVEGITNELEGASLYFSKPSPLPSPITEPPKNQAESTVAANLSELQPDQVSTPTPQIHRPKRIVTRERTTERTDERTSGRTNVRMYDHTMRRTKIRNAFDIFVDQLMSLREITLEREKITGSRVLLGDLVQEALDMFISKEKNKQ